MSRVVSVPAASLILLVLTVAVHGLFVFWKGFYMDDWRFIQLWESAPERTLPALMSALNVDSFWFYRPLDIPYFSVQYWLFGQVGWAYQALQLAFNAAGVLLLHAAWRRASGEAALSLLAAAIFAVYPNHSATHHWLSVPFAAVSALFAGALNLQLSAVRSGKFAPALGAAFLLAAAVLTYEAVLPLAVLMPTLSVLYLRRDGRSAADAWRATFRSTAPLALAAVAALLYQQALFPRLFPLGRSRPMNLDLMRVLKVFGRSIECSTSGVIALAADSARHAAEYGLWLLLPGIVLAAAAGIWLWRRSGADAPDAGPGGREWLLGAAGAWVAAYAPVALSTQDYMPHVFDEQNRLNAAGTVGGSMLAASALVFLARTNRRKTAAALLALFLSLSAGIDWMAGWAWMRSWALQTRVLSDIARQAPSGAADIFLSGVPETIGRAAVFHADWEFSCALHVWTRRSDLTGRLRATEPSKLPAGRRVLVYRYPSGRLE